MADKDQEQPGEPEENLSLSNPSPLGEIHDRKKLLEITGALINETYSRVSGERFRPRDGDAQRIAYIKLLRDLLSLHADLLKDSKAPAFQGLPAEPEPEDLEIERARKEELRTLNRLLLGLPATPPPGGPAPSPGKKGRAKT